MRQTQLKTQKKTEIEKPASHRQTWHTFLKAQEDEKNVIKNEGYACSFLSPDLCYY